MAVTASAFTPTAVSGAAVSFGRKVQRTTNTVAQIGGLNSYGGLKAHNCIAALGMPVCTEQGFANVVLSLKAASYGKRRGGGALSAKCSKIEEIFTIAAIMNGLVLVGVAVGFVLLRVEAWIEETEAAE